MRAHRRGGRSAGLARRRRLRHVAAGVARDGLIYVLADATVAGLTPQGWATTAIALWRRLEADSLIAEVNQGGDMVRAVIGEADSAVPVREVRATRGKYLRAEPVAQFYEQGRVKHAGTFPALEDEMCDFGLDGLSGGRSPDWLDALVWAVTAPTHGARGEPRVRGVVSLAGSGRCAAPGTRRATAASCAWPSSLTWPRHFSPASTPPV